MVQIRTLRDASLSDVIGLYNRGIENNPYSGQLDEATWNDTIAGKLYYSPDEVLIAYDDGRPLGYTHLCHAPNADRSGPDPQVGSIEALFFDPARPDAGAALLAAAVEQHQSGGARKVLGWSSFSGYPLYRGIFVGLEPLARAGDQHIVQAFHDAGFAYCQRSVEMVINYDQPVEEHPPQVELDYTVGPWMPASAWEQATWRGLEPYRSTVRIGDEQVGSCLYAMMPVISRSYGAPVACIGGLGINEQWRRKGIAAFLVARALNHMLALGARRLVLGTQHDNWAAHATYRKVGMEIEESLYAVELRLDRPD